MTLLCRKCQKPTHFSVQNICLHYYYRKNIGVPQNVQAPARVPRVKEVGKRWSMAIANFSLNCYGHETNSLLT